MKLLLFALIMSLLFACSTVQKSDVEAPISSGCESPALRDKSCVKLEQEPEPVSADKEMHKEISRNSLGLSKYNPIRVNGPAGQREYLSRLICPDGRKVKTFSRAGSVGHSPYGFMMDLYKVKCRGKTYSVYMDMYHTDYIESKAVDGFTIKD